MNRVLPGKTVQNPKPASRIYVYRGMMLSSPYLLLSLSSELLRHDFRSKLLHVWSCSRSLSQYYSRFAIGYREVVQVCRVGNPEYSVFKHFSDVLRKRSPSRRPYGIRTGSCPGAAYVYRTQIQTRDTNDTNTSERAMLFFPLISTCFSCHQLSFASCVKGC